MERGTIIRVLKEHPPPECTCAVEDRVRGAEGLCEGAVTPVDELVQVLGIAQSTTSHHLRVLKEAGLIQGDNRGRNAYYSFAPASGDRESR